VSLVAERQRRSRQPERFDCGRQLLCRDGLNGRCYWEVEWTGVVSIGVAYKGITRKGEGLECCLGGNEESWALYCAADYYTACHGQRGTLIRRATPPSSSSASERVGVYLDWPAGTVSYYRVSAGARRHIYSFQAKFTERVYPGFGFGLCTAGSSMTLCQV